VSTFNSVSEALDLLVDPFDNRGDWDEIIRRSAHPPTPQRRRRRTVFAVAFVALLAIAATALATGLADRFSAWISGTPGRPAPAAEQRGFSERNAGAYASFPRGTKLGLLLQQKAAETTFSLLGFRNGDTYCLRLIRSDHPAAIGRNQCLRAAELHGLAALVIDDAWFTIGTPAESVTGVFGFASDDVRSILVTLAHGTTQRFSVSDNVFLALVSQPAGTPQRHTIPNTILGVHALMRDGRRINIPYTINGLGIVPGGTKPTVPSYFGRATPANVPGPAKVTAPIAHPQIGWLSHHEKRGAANPSPREPWFAFNFSRVIRPDPNDPIAFAVGFGKPLHQPPLYHPQRGPDTCIMTFAPLQKRAGGVDCFPKPFANGPINVSGWVNDQVPEFSGIVADGITRLTVYLSSGRIVPAALRDNVFTVSLPQVELPGRIVGFNQAGKVAGISNLPGNSVARPCPAPVFVRSVAQLPAAKPWEQINLATMQIGGHRVLGETPARVEAALGTPDRIDKNASRENGVSVPRLFYGGTLPSTAGLTVSFTRSSGQIYANTLTYQSPSLTDAKLGHILREQPVQLQRQIQTIYSSAYRPFFAYGADPRLGCMGTFRDRASRAGISFGLNPYRPSRPYLTMSTNGGG
jgi:hypothetical protein